MPAASVSTTPDDASAASSPLLSDDDSDITAHFDALDDDDLIEPPKKLDGALIFGIAMAVAGAVLIILVAIAVFSPHR